MSAEFNPIGSGRQTGSSTDLRPLERVRALMADSFQFTAPDSPGLHFCGGLADPQLAGLSAALPRISVVGSDLSADGAETRCLGEAAERLSSLYDPSRDLKSVPAADIPADLLACIGTEAMEHECLAGQRLNDGAAVWVPAAVCLHDPAAPAQRLPAKGIAAGPDWQSAVERAVAELVERDAAALWWLGGQMPAPVSLDVLARGDAGAVLQMLRGDQTGRSAWVLDISTEFGLTVFAAVSVMGNGEGFACGLAAAADPAEAMRSALVEMAQMELSQHLIRGKAKALGPEGLTEGDFRQIERSARITPETCPLIAASGPLRAQASSSANAVAQIALQSTVYAVDCTLLGLDVPVAVVLTLIEGFLLSGPGGRMEISPAKARAMFAHLALSPNMEQTRERLAGLLWGGDD